MDMLLLEQLVSRSDQDIQIGFAREAVLLLGSQRAVRAEATRRGVLLLGESEPPLIGAVRILREHFGDVIDAAEPEIRPEACPDDSEPVMTVRVDCPVELCDSTRASLLWRGASITAFEGRGGRGSIAAVAPLRELLGFAEDLDRLSGGRAVLEMRFSHFRAADLDPVPPGAA